MENILKVLTTTNLLFILKGLWLTLQISFISIVLSTIFGTILAVMRAFISNLSVMYPICSGFSLSF